MKAYDYPYFSPEELGEPEQPVCFPWLESNEYKGDDYSYTSKDGYVMVRDVDGVLGRKRAMVKEHRLIVANELGRPLKNTEVVHHINRNKSDNRLENLLLINSKTHSIIHSYLNLLDEVVSIVEKFLPDDSNERKRYEELKQRFFYFRSQNEK